MKSVPASVALTIILCATSAAGASMIPPQCAVDGVASPARRQQVTQRLPRELRLGLFLNNVDVSNDLLGRVAKIINSCRFAPAYVDTIGHRNENDLNFPERVTADSQRGLHRPRFNCSPQGQRIAMSLQPPHFQSPAEARHPPLARPLQPCPRMKRPVGAPVALPLSRATPPLTRTCRTPVASWFGFV